MNTVFSGLAISAKEATLLRTLLNQGTHSVLRRLKSGGTPTQRWLEGLLTRCHPNVAVVALANKNARVACALLAPTWCAPCPEELPLFSNYAHTVPPRDCAYWDSPARVFFLIPT